MNKGFFGIVLVASLLVAASICGNGCATYTSVTLQSNKDLVAMHDIKRLFVIIDQGVFEKQPVSKKLDAQVKSDVLAASLQNCLSNTPVQMETGIVNPLALNGQNFEPKIQEFQADAVLIISVRNLVMDQFGGCPVIYYYASLRNEITHKFVWRAVIKNSGDPDAMNQRMQKMAGAIVAQLRADGYIESQQGGSPEK